MNAHHQRGDDRILVIGAGMAGLAAAMTLSAAGREVVLLEKQATPGGKMRQIGVDGSLIDSGPTVFTMKWVFDELFAASGQNLDTALDLHKAKRLARHAWDAPNSLARPFDLFANREESRDEIGELFGFACAEGYTRFCRDAGGIHDTLRDTFMAAQLPGPVELARRVGFHRIGELLALRPFSTLWKALDGYFPDQRLQQLFGRYSTYVGSSPYCSPATLMLIAHVEQQGVWTISGGMHALARAMRDAARLRGALVMEGARVERIVTNGGKANGVELADGTRLNGSQVLYAGDMSWLTADRIGGRASPVKPVPPKDRALSAITWSVKAQTNGFDMHRHNVFFSDDYRAEFDAIFKDRRVPQRPTVYVCAQNRDDNCELMNGTDDTMLVLMNAPAFGDTTTLDDGELARCEEATFELLKRCGLEVEREPWRMVATQPADFETLFPGSGGSIYGRASHGWMASFARPGSTTKIPGLYLAGGSVHPGAGVPMAALSGRLAAQAMMRDRASTSRFHPVATDGGTLTR